MAEIMGKDGQDDLEAQRGHGLELTDPQVWFFVCHINGVRAYAPVFIVCRGNIIVCHVSKCNCLSFVVSMSGLRLSFAVSTSLFYLSFAMTL